jgi:quercetin dioxygenase-like cupin family protein
MEVVTIDKIDVDKNAPVPLRELFNQTSGDGKVTVGTVTIPPGKRVPIEGMSNHHQNEYAVVVKGTLVTESGGKTYHVSSGQATFIPAGEEHIAFNDSEEDCEIVWVLVG